MKPNLKKNFGLVTIFLITGIFFISPVNGAEIVMKVGTAVSAKSITGTTLVKFKAMAEERTKGKVKVELFPDAQLGGELEEIEKLYTGVIQGTYISVAAMSSVAPKLRFTFLPYLFPNWEAAEEFLSNQDYLRKIFGSLEEKGIIMLEPIILGEYNISTAKRPFLSVKDVSGLKIRAKENPVSIDGLKAMGASPMPMAFPEIYQALQRGTLDAISMPVQYTLTSKFYEVVKFITVSDIEFLFSGFEVNKKWWEGLPKDVRVTLASALKEAFDWERKQEKSYYDQCIFNLMKEGVFVRYLAKEEKREFRKLTEQVRDKYSKDLGMQDILKEVEMKNKDLW